MIDEPKLHGILHDRVDEAWPYVSPIIQKAIPYTDGKYELENILEGIKSRDMQLWSASRDGKATTIMVTKILQYPQKKTLLIMLYAGEHTNKMTQFSSTIYEWAKNNGCYDVMLYGRTGWEKTLKNDGYEKVHTVLRRKL